MDNHHGNVLEQVRLIVAETLRISPEEVNPDVPLGEALGAESLDFIDIVFRIQSTFNVSFHEGGVVEKLMEVFEPGELVDGDRLTEIGARVLRLRMPEVGPGQLRSGLPTSQIEALYTVNTFVRAVQELIDARPQECPNCRSPELRPVRPSLLKCTNCAEQVASPAQGQILEHWGNEARRTVVDS